MPHVRVTAPPRLRMRLVTRKGGSGVTAAARVMSPT
jgi:hypothetical protein